MPYGIFYENDLWIVRHLPPSGCVVGWITMQSRRHVAGPAFFNDAEVNSLGPTLRHLSQIVLEATGCLRVYVGAMGESFPHFHMHLVPRYEDGPKGWPVFLQPTEAAAGRLQVDESKVEAMALAIKAKLGENPPPPPPSQ